MPRTSKMPQYRALDGTVQWLEELMGQAVLSPDGTAVIRLQYHQYRGLQEDLPVYRAARSKKR